MRPPCPRGSRGPGPQRNKMQRMALIETKSADAWFTDGCRFEVMNSPDQAREAYGQAVKADPSFLPAHVNLGFMHLRDGDYEASLKCFTRALALQPETPENLNNLGYICER